MHNRLRFAVGVALIFAAVVYLIATAIESTSEYYLTVNEVRGREAELMGQSIRVAGRVKPGTIRWDPVTLTLKFAMMPLPPADGDALKPVASGPPVLFDVVGKGEPKPDMLADNRDVIVDGSLASAGLLEARQVLTKCPSKYVPQGAK